ncbi:putative Late nodulin [Medicago truncatula]|uniref:Nodule Cysteine-Rich (NCR) secreted peptide n=1 Tax=Medicago truncatula TaxID=3880 RepID=A7KH72_MEDTR|nr:nodule-specific cysteine-rich peptide 53 [Medicago truncatula]AFK35443.1 unknown [Medicago truncatula]KEH41133.1 Nodule Cysteine-Rich (NCR) secreted peptide [Medicago truncatula]RHN78590.1 putative Late nodulin [Medicago truncatula]
MTHISKFVFALIIFLSIYVGVNDCKRIPCKDNNDCNNNWQLLACRFEREVPRCINSICKCMPM